MTETHIATNEPLSRHDELRSKLTPLQARFADEFMIDFNGSQAAQRAGSKAENTRVAAHEFLTNPNVAAYVEFRRKEQHQRARMTAERLLEMLQDEAEADLLDIQDAEGNIRPVSEWPMAFRRGLVTGIEIETKYESDGEGGSRDLGRVAKVKIESRSKVKELIGRHVGVQAFKENVTLSGAIGVAAIPVEKLTEEQLRVIAGLPTKTD